jgi:AcrR family transcriptional regulator
MEEQGSEMGEHGGDAAPERVALIEAMLRLSGEIGYRATTLERLRERSGVDGLAPFFQSREECFAAAYSVEADRLCGVFQEAWDSRSSWRDQLRAALGALFAYVAERPVPSRVLLIEAQVAGGAALARQEEISGRLARALDEGACREIGRSRHTPPPITAEFMVGAIAQTVRSFLLAGDPAGISASLPELMHLLVGPYLGEEAAAEELSRTDER